jgi:ribosome-associated toxin RatA of RatAB toxin-antitoxin module
MLGREKRGRGAGIGALVLAAVCVLSGAPRAAQVAVIPDEESGACKVRGVFVVPVAPAVVWDVLTDYQGIGKFVPSVRESRIEPQPDGRQLLRQDAVGSVMFVHRRIHVLLELQEERERRIAFHDVLGRDFRSYSGEWRIASDSSLIQVDYELDAEPRSAIMRAFCRGAMQSAAEDLLEQVRAEIMRRGALAKGLTSGSEGRAAPAGH